MPASPLTYIFIDDSGALYDPNEPIVTVVALVVRDLSTIQWITRRIRRDVMHRSSEPHLPSEFKFYNTTAQVRGRVLSALAKESVEIYTLSVHKGRQRVEDTVENFAALLCALLGQCLPSGEALRLVIDSHFSQKEKETRLADLIREGFGLEALPMFADSKKNSMIQLADFVAGAIRYAHTGRSTVYYEFIRLRVVENELRTWKEVKREWRSSTRFK